MPPPQVMGMYPADSIVEVHSTLPLDPLASGSSELLAADVEYRIHLIAQEARKFMVAGKRRTLRPEDVEMAMEAMNVEPVLVPPLPLGASPSSSSSLFVPLPTGASSTLPSGSAAPSHSHSHGPTYYHTPDEEIDFSLFLRNRLPPALKNREGGVRWKAHWLAVEGVQPAVPENPAPAGSAASLSLSSTTGPAGVKGERTNGLAAHGPAHAHGAAGGGSAGVSTGQASLRASAKQVLPQELQLYFYNLTASLVPDPSSSSVSASAPALPAGSTTASGSSARSGTEDQERHRLAALASLRSDPAVGGILEYLVRWLNDSITKSLAVPASSAGGGGTTETSEKQARDRTAGQEQLRVLGWLLDGVGAVLENTEVFLEPYLHTLLPPLLSVLLTTPLGPDASSSSASASARPGSQASHGHQAHLVSLTGYDLRLRSSDLLSLLLDLYSSKYPGLRPRLLSVFKNTLFSDPGGGAPHGAAASAGRYEGALLGLAAVGAQGVKKVLLSPSASSSSVGMGMGMERLGTLFPMLYPGQPKLGSGEKPDKSGSGRDKAQHGSGEKEKDRPGLIRALGRCFSRLTGAPPTPLPSSSAPASQADLDLLRSVLGDVGLRALGVGPSEGHASSRSGKGGGAGSGAGAGSGLRAWRVGEMGRVLRAWQEELEAISEAPAGAGGSVKREGGMGMDVDA